MDKITQEAYFRQRFLQYAEKHSVTETANRSTSTSSTRAKRTLKAASRQRTRAPTSVTGNSSQQPSVVSGKQTCKEEKPCPSRKQTASTEAKSELVSHRTESPSTSSSAARLSRNWKLQRKRHATITGLMCAVMDKKLSSAVGFRGICKKVLILMLVGVANIMDVHVIGTGSALRGAVICFYLSNEGVLAS